MIAGLTETLRTDVTREQLIGKFARLRGELIEAHARRRDPSYIERLIDDLADTRRALADGQAHDEQTGDSAFGLGW